MSFVTFQVGVTLIIWIVFAVLKIWAFVDCLRQRADAFPAVQRQSKTLWLILTGIAALTGLLPDPLGIMGIAGIVVALIYLFEIKPRIKASHDPPLLMPLTADRTTVVSELNWAQQQVSRVGCGPVLRSGGRAAVEQIVGVHDLYA